MTHKVLPKNKKFSQCFIPDADLITTGVG